MSLPQANHARNRLPNRRAAQTFAFERDGAHFEMTAGFYPDGRPGEVFLNAGAREGERNQMLFWSACRLAERVSAGQLSQREASALLNAAAHEAGLTENEAQRTIQSAWRAA